MNGAPFEVLRFRTTPATDDVALVELTGRFGATPDDGRVRLRVEHPERRLELRAVAAARDGDLWRATFAVPLDLVDDAAYALAMRGLVLELPDPDRAEDRTAQLARELNRMRRAVEAAEARAGEASAAADGRIEAALAEARERADARVSAAEGEANAARSSLLQAERRCSEADERLARAQQETGAVRRELEQAWEAARAGEQALQAALEAARDEAIDLRRALKQARAEVEAARREQAAAQEREGATRAELTRTVAVRGSGSGGEPRSRPDDDEPTRVAARGDDPPTLHDRPVPAGEPVERVRVLGGRARRAPDPDAPPTPVDAPPLDPPSHGPALIVLAGMLVLAAVVLALLLA